MKILLTGGKGMLARTISQCWQNRYELIPTDLPDADITNADAIDSVVRKHQPDIVLHCAAMTAVDRCESRTDDAFRINVLGSENVARAAFRNRARLIAISTDYVFDGTLDRPYSEYDTPHDPKTVYGQTKLEAERRISSISNDFIIARISWLFGIGGPSFVHTMVKLAKSHRDSISVVNDQIGNPTSAFSVADSLQQFLDRPDLHGVFHLTCEGEATWYDFACEIFRQTGISQKVIPCTSKEYPTPANRPPNSRLEKRRLRENNLRLPPDWHDALRFFLSNDSSWNL